LCKKHQNIEKSHATENFSTVTVLLIKMHFPKLNLSSKLDETDQTPELKEKSEGNNLQHQQI